MQRGHIALEDNFNQLDEGRNDQNEDDRLHVSKVYLAREQKVVDRPGDGSCQHLDENHGQRHAGRLVEFLGYAQKRADAEEFDEHIVVRDRGGQNDEDHGLHFAAASFPSQAPLPQPGQPAQPNSFFLMALPLEI